MAHRNPEHRSLSPENGAPKSPEARQPISAAPPLPLEKVEPVKTALGQKRTAALQAHQGDRMELATTLSPEQQKALIEKEMQIEDLKTLPVEQLLTIEKQRPGILLFAFTTWGEKHAGKSIEQFESYQQPKNGDRLSIDFRGNTEAYWKLGADDILPPHVRNITIWPNGDPGKERVSDRRVGLKSSAQSGFYDQEGYIPIFSRDTVILGKPKKQETQTETHEAQETLFDEGVDDTFKSRYLKPDGQWDEEKYKQEHADEDGKFLNDLCKTLKPVPLQGEEFSPAKLRELGLKKRLDASDLNAVLDAPERQGWREAAQAAARHYAERFGVSIKPSSIFAIIQHESNFNPAIPNLQGSRALGLGQFIPGTWLEFVKENKDVIRRIYGRVPLTKNGKLALRTDPELSIWATTWLAAKSARSLNLKKEGGVNEENSYLIYLAHAEGLGGYGKLAPFFEGDMSFEENKAAVERSGRKLEFWQTKEHADFIKSYALKLQQTAKRYTTQWPEIAA